MFKVGDKVKAVEASGGWDNVKPGDVGVVAEISTSEIFSYLVDFPHRPSWYANDGDLQLLEEPKENPIKQKHPQAEFIKAWLDGVEVEASGGESLWFTVKSLVTFDNYSNFRIKPKSQVLFASLIVEEDDYYKGKYIPSICDYVELGQIGHNLKLTIENGELVDVQLIKQSD